MLDREPGAGGLQVHSDAGGWEDAPYDPDALTVDVGDLLAHRTGMRWRSGRHRVLPPQAGAPHEEADLARVLLRARPRRAREPARAADRAARGPGAGGVGAVPAGAPHGDIGRIGIPGG
ncbi:2OG-Fe(II) oxygenase family protein [Pseudonocardia oceani]|uniref:2OG-Fe(II) oxygenase family protein n=1 Tax=Pseudonocardia oceani TaxID=2792013 RepID=UPI001E5CFFBD|nr:2OG-Fe(II) oxygenase family protein [Pseudonocardia oceani]